MGRRPYLGPSGRIQHRGAGARFRRSTLADVGLDACVCRACAAINPRALGDPLPETCTQCGAPFVHETCAWCRKVEPRHLGPEDFADVRAGAFAPCGRPAVATDLGGGPRCELHVGLAVGETPTRA